MSKSNAIRADKGLSEVIRREWRRDDSRRLLRGHPAFKTDERMPDMLTSLLDRLDDVEGGRSAR